MTKLVFKYDLAFEVDTLSLPEGSEILTVRYQASEYGEGLKLWAFVPSPPTQLAKKQVTFVTVPTGAHVMDKPMKYIATVETPQGEIFHTFQLL